MTSTKLSEEDVKEDEKEVKGPCFGERHILTVLCSIVLGATYCMRVDLSVAIVAMVNNSAIMTPSHRNDSAGECPVSEVNGTPNKLPPDGPFLWSRDLQGQVLGSFFWGYLVLQLAGGTLSQRFGGKWILATAVLTNIILTALAPLAATTSPYLLIAVRILQGVFQSVCFPAAQAMLGRWVPPKEVAFLYAVAYSGCTIGTVVSQVASGQLAESEWGWPSAFYFNAAISLLCLIPWFLLVSNSPEENPRISAEELTYIIRHLGQGSQERSNKLGIPWLRIFTDPAVWAIVVGLVCMNWEFYLILTCLPQYLSDVLHFNISTNGILSSLPYLMCFSTSLIAGLVCDILVSKSYVRPVVTRKVNLLGGSICIALCLVGVVVFACNTNVTVALLMLMMGCVGSAGITFAANAAELSPEYAGTMIGVANTFGTLPGFLAPIVTDHLTVHGSKQEWAKVFYIGAGIAVFGSVFYTIFGASRPRNWHCVDERTGLLNADVDDSIHLDI